jgi:hypothetical protein
MTHQGGDHPDSHRRMAHEVDPDLIAERRHRSERPVAAGRRPLVERLGMAVIAIVIALLFGGVAVASFAGGEPFLGIMGAIGAAMTVWVGLATLLRG